MQKFWKGGLRNVASPLTLVMDSNTTHTYDGMIWTYDVTSQLINKILTLTCVCADYCNLTCVVNNILTKVNSTLHSSGVAKSSTSFGWGKGG